MFPNFKVDIFVWIKYISLEVCHPGKHLIRNEQMVAFEDQYIENLYNNFKIWGNTSYDNSLQNDGYTFFISSLLACTREVREGIIIPLILPYVCFVWLYQTWGLTCPHGWPVKLNEKFQGNRQKLNEIICAWCDKEGLELCPIYFHVRGCQYYKSKREG